ncbi:hypothetical protein Rsub_06036 [Raphidocelis subcapitata]|uniref:peptidyl-tRNA hydrolase n=1 Tax=Raphidocelis subcapitata TaxID=307507 RepID=A0A2V0P0B2_9CHLO|nr:hypothetical protein Rsub_06036 [Raphidocelis subcapitata]|eukprot:GBF93304.1 hypothetical protein Rsub_06036 [Raphidocelis subcapitata]
MGTGTGFLLGASIGASAGALGCLVAVQGVDGAETTLRRVWAQLGSDLSARLGLAPAKDAPIGVEQAYDPSSSGGASLRPERSGSGIGGAGSGGDEVLSEGGDCTHWGGFTPGTSSLSRSTSDVARSAGDATGAPGDRLKMVVVVREDVAARWNRSKLAVMVSSSLIGLYKRVYRNRAQRGLLVNWEAQKAAKLILVCPDEAALGALLDGARDAGVPAHCLLETVAPAAPGEAPSRARAVVALGPATQAALAAAGCQSLPSLP